MHIVLCTMYCTATALSNVAPPRISKKKEERQKTILSAYIVIVGSRCKTWAKCRTFYQRTVGSPQSFSKLQKTRLGGRLVILMLRNNHGRRDAALEWTKERKVEANDEASRGIEPVWMEWKWKWKLRTSSHVFGLPFQRLSSSKTATPLDLQLLKPTDDQKFIDCHRRAI